MMQDDQTRRALLDGRWDEPKVGGGIYTEVLNKAREDKRIFPFLSPETYQ